MKIKIDELRTKIIETLTSNGFSEADSESVADVLIWCDMSGINVMGTMKLTGPEPIQLIKPKHDIEVERETKISALLNAGANPAPLATQVATNMAIDKAKESGFAIVGLHNTFSSNLAQGYYVEKIANQGLIGIMMSSNPATVAPFNIIEPVLGTNPIGFGFPTSDKPFVIDMTTSSTAYFSLIRAESLGQELPDGTAIDKNGKPTNNPTAALEGALVTFGNSYKSSSLSLAIEILCGPLVKAAYADTALDSEYGTTIIAMDPALLVDPQEFKDQNTDLIKKLKKAKKKSGDTEVRLPGERAAAAYQASKDSGEVDIDDSILKELGYI